MAIRRAGVSRVVVAALVLPSAIASAADVTGEPFTTPPPVLGDCELGHLQWLTRPDLPAGSPHGSVLAVEGDLLVVGAASVQTDSAASDVSVYRRVSQSFVLEGSLRPLDGWPGDGWGASVAVVDGRVLVAAPEAEKVVQFERVGGAWGPTAVLAEPEPVVGFGFAISVAGGELFVHASGPSSSGILYTYERQGDGWSYAQKIQSPTPAASQRFGLKVVGNPGLIFVSEPLGTTSTGRVHRYQRVDNVWTWVEAISGTTTAEQFGVGLAYENDTLVVGAPSFDGASADCGVVRIFDVSSMPATLSQTLNAQANVLQMGRAVAIREDVLAVVRADRRDLGGATVYRRESEDFMRVGCTAHAPWRDMHGASARDVALLDDAVAVGLPLHPSMTAWGSLRGVGIASIDGPDCDADGVPDWCGLLGSEMKSSQTFTSFGGSTSVSFGIGAAKHAVGALRFTVLASGGILPTSGVRVLVNGEVLGEASFADDLNSVCNGKVVPLQVVVSATAFNTAVGPSSAGNDTVTLQPFGTWASCAPSGTVQCTVRYPVSGDPVDTDLDGRPDACGLTFPGTPEPPPDGRLTFADSFDRASFGENWGIESFSFGWSVYLKDSKLWMESGSISFGSVSAPLCGRRLVGDGVVMMDVARTGLDDDIGFELYGPSGSNRLIRVRYQWGGAIPNYGISASISATSFAATFSTYLQTTTEFATMRVERVGEKVSISALISHQWYEILEMSHPDLLLPLAIRAVHANSSAPTGAQLGWIDNVNITGLMELGCDLDLDGDVGAADLALVISSFGPCGASACCEADLNGDENVDGSDISTLLADWGS
jgi:hypothetical protein